MNETVRCQGYKLIALCKFLCPDKPNTGLTMFHKKNCPFVVWRGRKVHQTVIQIVKQFNLYLCLCNKNTESIVFKLYDVFVFANEMDFFI